MFAEKSLGAWREEIEADPEMRKLLDNGVGATLRPILNAYFPEKDPLILPREGTINSKNQPTDNLRKRIFDMADAICSPTTDTEDPKFYLQCWVGGRVAKILGDKHAEGNFDLD